MCAIAFANKLGAQHLLVIPGCCRSGHPDWVYSAVEPHCPEIMTRVAAWSKLKAWAMNVAKRRGAKRAKVALARKLGVVLHRMWVDELEFRFGNPAQA